LTGFDYEMKMWLVERTHKMDNETRAMLKTSDIKITGETATVMMKGQTKPVELRKVEGKWLLTQDSPGLNPPQNARDRQLRRHDIRVGEVTRELYDAFLKDLSSRKFASGKEAMVAFGRLPEAARVKVQAEDAASRPATGSATRP
jgi:hypothetical protein